MALNRSSLAHLTCPSNYKVQEESNGFTRVFGRDFAALGSDFKYDNKINSMKISETGLDCVDSEFDSSSDVNFKRKSGVTAKRDFAATNYTYLMPPDRLDFHDRQMSTSERQLLSAAEIAFRRNHLDIERRLSKVMLYFV